MEKQDPMPNGVTLDDNHISTLQEIVTAIGCLPGVWDKIDAYMRGRDIDDPMAEMNALRKAIF